MTLEVPPVKENENENEHKKKTKKEIQTLLSKELKEFQREQKREIKVIRNNNDLSSIEKRHKIARLLRTYIIQRHGEDILKLIDDKMINTSFKTIKDFSFCTKNIVGNATYFSDVVKSDITTTNPKGQIENQLTSIRDTFFPGSNAAGESPRTADMPPWLLKTDGTEKTTRKEFATFANLTLTHDGRVELKSGTTAARQSKIKTLADIQKIMKDFLYRKAGIDDNARNNIPKPEQETIDGLLDPDILQPELIMGQAMVTERKKNFMKILDARGSGGTDKDESIKLFNNYFFGKNTLGDLSLDALSPVINLQTVSAKFDSFLSDAEFSFSDEEKDMLQETYIYNSDILKAGVATGNISQGDAQVLNSNKIKDRRSKYRNFFGNLATHSIPEMLHDRELSDENLHQSLDFLGNTPTSLSDFFEVFRHPTLQILKDQHTGSEISAYTSYKTDIIEAQRDPDNQLKKAKAKQAKEQQEKLHWQWYTRWLKTKLQEENEGRSERTKIDVASTLAAFIAWKQVGFSLVELSLSHQNSLLRAMIARKLYHDPGAFSLLDPNLLSLDKDKLETFVLDLYDLESSSIKIPDNEGELTIDVKKTLSGKPPHAKLGFDDWNALKDMHMPINFELTVSPDVEQMLLATGSDVFFYDIKDSTGEKKIGDGYLCDVQKGATAYNDVYLSPHGPYEGDEYEDDSPHAMYMYRGAPPTKPGAQGRTIVVDDNGVPITIRGNDTTNTISVKQKKININGDKIARLMGSYAIGEFGLQKKPLEQQETLKNKIEKLPKKEMLDEKKTSDLESEKGSQEKVDDFFSGISKEMKGANHLLRKENVRENFIKGVFYTRDAGVSPIPPNMGGDSFVKWTIADIKMTGDNPTVTFKINGTELPFTKDLENREITVPLSGDVVTNLKDVFGDLYFMPKGSDKIEDYLSLISNKETDFGTDIDNNHDLAFIKKKGDFFESKFDGEDKKVMYFTGEQGYVHHDDEKGPEPQDQDIIYKVEKGKGGYRVSTTYLGDFQKKDKKGNPMGKVITQKWKYDEVMDTPSLALFLAEKKLVPKTDEQAKIIKEGIQAKDITLPKRGNMRGGLIKNIFSLGEMGGAIKSLWTGRQEKYKAVSEGRKEEFEEFLIHDVKILGMAKKIFGDHFPFGDIHNALDNLEDEKITGYDKKLSEKIKGYTDYLEGLGDTGAATKDVVLPRLDKCLNSEKAGLKARHKAFGAMIFMCKKNKSLYARKLSKYPRGSRVKALMGESMAAQFRWKASMLEAKLSKSGNNDDVLDGLNRLEVQFIVDNIRGGAPYGTDGNLVNDHIQKNFEREYGKAAASELLKEFDDNVLDKTGIDETYTKLKDKESFTFAYGEFEKQLTQNRVKDAIAAFKAMANNAKASHQVDKVMMAASSLILTGTMRYDCDAEMKNYFVEICRSINFLPGIRAMEYQSMEKMQWLFDFVSNKQFTKMTGYNVGNNDFLTRTDKSYNALWNGDKSNNLVGIKSFWAAHGSSVVDFMQAGNIGERNGDDVLTLAQDLKPGEPLPRYKGKQISTDDHAHLCSLKELLLEPSNQNANSDIKNPSYYKKNALSIPLSYFNEIVVLDKTNPNQFKSESAKGKRTADSLCKSISGSVPQGNYGGIEFGAKRSYILRRMHDFFGNSMPSKGVMASTISTCSNIINNTSGSLPNPRHTAEYVLKMKLYDAFYEKGTRMIFPDSYKKAFDSFVSFMVQNLSNFRKNDIASAYGEDTANQRHTNEYLLPVSQKQYNNRLFMDNYFKELGTSDYGSISNTKDQLVNEKIRLIDKNFVKNAGSSLSKTLGIDLFSKRENKDEEYDKGRLNMVNTHELAKRAAKEASNSDREMTGEDDFDFNKMLSNDTFKKVERITKAQEAEKKKGGTGTKSEQTIRQQTIDGLMKISRLQQNTLDEIMSSREIDKDPERIRDILVNKNFTDPEEKSRIYDYFVSLKEELEPEPVPA